MSALNGDVLRARYRPVCGLCNTELAWAERGVDTDHDCIAPDGQAPVHFREAE